VACAAIYNACNVWVLTVVRPIWPSVDTASDPAGCSSRSRRACTKLDAICSHASSLDPRPGQCPAPRPRSTARPITAKMAIGSALGETVGSGGRTAHSSAVDRISCGHPRTIPSARSADMSSSASRANPSLSSRSSATVRPSPADTGVRLPHQLGHCGTKIVNSFPHRSRRKTS
jgi:hypothetical protein